MEKKLTVNCFREKGFQQQFTGNLEGTAALSHYVHSESQDEKLYKQTAINYVQQFLSYKQPTSHISFKVAEEVVQYSLEGLFGNIPFPAPENPKFTFIDLFAGIGGFRMALQNLGGKCIFTSEWDKYAKQTYEANYGDVPFGDITKSSTKNYIPETFDILCAGFPCQAFSIAGKRGGFEDTRGTLFFDVAEIIKNKQPKVIFLENVKGLKSHDKGKTLATILNTLRNDLNYFVPDPEVLNAKDFGVPQNRERIFIVGFRKDQGIDSFNYPNKTKNKVQLKEIYDSEEVSVKYYLSTVYLETLKKHKARHASKGNGFGYEIISDNGVANALVCGGMGRERNLIIDNRLTNFIPVTSIKGEVNREGIRKMTPREWARLQGYPDQFNIVVSDVQAYKQFGNSVAVPVIQAVASEIVKMSQFHGKYE